MNAHLHGDAAGWEILELSVESILSGWNTTFFNHFTFLIQDDDY
jgi:hypothetical protein